MELPGDAKPPPDRIRSRAMLISASAFGQTLALLATFLGIGVLVNLLIVYIVGQVMVERKQNQERMRNLES
jgi:hypothetical protein